ncbi:MAG: NACHT domain-containing protein [Caldilineaceae bacterium]|nr:NACHT domain-containing protein [Caldilineaceae bacterium]MCB0097875.1 NACHT domain-containing protein [Caldilineaceae bacterium]MCB0143059.1 NACHT domain-containing protein [Caldilineaceae bacterium]
MYPEFADALIKHLRHRDRSPAWLAGKLEIHPSTVNRWLNNQTRPGTVEIVLQIAQILALSKEETGALIRFADYVAPAPTSPPPVSSIVHNADFAAYDAHWVGRNELIQMLSQKSMSGHRILLLVGMAGIGKTALAERIAVELTQSDPTIQLSRLNFDHRSDQPDFVGVMAPWLDEWDNPVPQAERTTPQLLLERLMRFLRQEKRLLIIDALENVLAGDSIDAGNYCDPWWKEFFQKIFSVETLQSRIIITSQQLPVHFVQVGSQYPARWHYQRISGLTEAEQMTLFVAVGAAQNTSPRTGQLLHRIGAIYDGHPLVLRTIAGELVSSYEANIDAYWRAYGEELEHIESELLRAQQNDKLHEANTQWQLDRFSPALQRQVQHRLEKMFERLKEHAYPAYIMLCGASVYLAPSHESWWLRHLAIRNYSSVEQNAALQALRDRYLIDESFDTEGNRLIGLHNLIRSIALKHRGAFT